VQVGIVQAGIRNPKAPVEPASADRRPGIDDRLRGIIGFRGTFALTESV